MEPTPRNHGDATKNNAQLVSMSIGHHVALLRYIRNRTRQARAYRLKEQIQSASCDCARRYLRRPIRYCDTISTSRVPEAEGKRTTARRCSGTPTGNEMKRVEQLGAAMEKRIVVDGDLTKGFGSEINIPKKTVVKQYEILPKVASKRQ